ncbi:MAG: M23 family metallopeptidase [Termitinemataceae bacterium]|nr:MAG: M23 family metallopeptidase [Termitinemataceae bacterium]
MLAHQRRLKKLNTHTFKQKCQGDIFALAFFLNSFLSISAIYAQVDVFDEPPLIKDLSSKDVVFKQFLQDKELGNKLRLKPGVRSEDVAGALTIYRYFPKDTDTDFMQIAARTIGQDALATLNRIAYFSKSGFSHSGVLLLPSIKGVFLPVGENIRLSDLEKMIASTRGADAGVVITVNLGGQKSQWRFIPGDEFSPNERLFFVHPKLFRFPLDKWHLTSPFGMRVSPISGRAGLHKGLDMAAPAGSAVFAARDGTVKETGYNGIYGNFVTIAHEGGWISLYGHLSQIDTVSGSTVKAGQVIGKVGSTGLSTGPHLHFELRQSNKALDPGALLK